MNQFKRIHRTDGLFSLTPNPVATNKMRFQVMERLLFLAPLPLARYRTEGGTRDDATFLSLQNPSLYVRQMSVAELKFRHTTLMTKFCPPIFDSFWQIRKTERGHKLDREDIN